MRLKDKVVLITGAASGLEGQVMGFGGAAAWRCALEGARLALSDVDESRGQLTTTGLQNKDYEAEFFFLDVTSEQNWINVIASVLERFGRLDVLVNNAGIGGMGGNVTETTETEWNEQMDVHAKGAFLGTKHAIPAMLETGGGSIVNVSSINGLIATPDVTAYDVAKAALRHLTKSTAVQYAAQNIRANSIHPGYAWTPMTEASFSDLDEYALRVSRVPMGKMANADDIAWGIVYLASDESAYVTGSELVIDGGLTAQ